MAHSTVSAVPEMLYRYTDCSTQLDHDLIANGSRLVETLNHFENRCKEPSFRVAAIFLAQNLKSYGEQNLPIAEQVRHIGRAFALADGMQLGVQAGATWWGNFKQWLASVNIQEIAKSALRFVPIIGPPPAWLALKLGELSWLKPETASTATNTALGNLVEEQQVDTSSVRSKSDVVSQPVDPIATPELSDKTQVNISPPKTAKLNTQATTSDCVAFVKSQPDRKVPSGFNQKVFYSGEYKGQSGKLHDGTEYGQEPKPGAIMVESPNTNAKISYGHASYVYEVNYDVNGKTVGYKIAEGNWGKWKENGTPPPIHYDEFHWNSEHNYYVSKSGKRSPDMFIY